MKKWEYKLVNFAGGDEDFNRERTLNDFGVEGWRVIHVSGSTNAYVLEREVTEGDKPIGITPQPTRVKVLPKQS